MNYGQTYITTAGQMLASKTLEGKTLQFTKFVIGDGTLTDDSLDTVKALTNLINPVLNFNVTNIKRNGQTQVDLQGTFKNTELENATHLRELGLFAKDPDTQQEVLFTYVNYGDNAEYINNSELEKQERFYDMYIVIDNADNVTITVDSSTVYATVQQLNEALSDKADVPVYYTLTLLTTGWTQNTTTEKYEYTVEDESITKDHHITCNMNIENQNKLKDAEGDSYNGGFTIRTTELPTEDITMDITIQKMTKRVTTTPETPTEPTTPDVSETPATPETPTEGGDTNENEV